MALVDLDKFVASMTEHYCRAHNIDRSVIRCWIDSVLEDQGLEYEDGKKVKNQRRISAEAKENGYGESEDERIRKAIINIFATHKDYEVYFGVSVEDIRVWLERQGEQKAINDTDEDIVKAVKDTSILDMVEPMFKAGDYIKHNKANIICKIISVNSGSYYVENIETNGEIELFNAEQNFHLWSIKDAKPGDVLAEDSCIFIIQKLGDNNTAAKTYCTLYDDGDFDDGTILYFDIDSTKPATKEQRDQLFQKMHEAGYTFDFEKKELKKIEEKPWSEEDERIKKYLISFIKIESGVNLPPDDAGKILAWIKKQGENHIVKNNEMVKLDWSEEDERNLQGIIDEIEANKNQSPDYDLATYNRFLSWLKSLKDRYTWKPSEEQIKAVRLARVFVTDDFSDNPTLSETLTELEEQLKKLKGE